MRILWVAHFLPYPPRGGAPQRSYNLLREIARRAEVHVAGASLTGHQPQAEDFDQAVAALSEFCASVSAERLVFKSSRAGKAWAAVHALAARRAHGETWLASPAAAARVASVLARVAPDAVHVDSLMATPLLPDTLKEPAILNHHNVESHMMARRAENASGPLAGFLRREARLLAKLERRTASRFAAHLTVSELDRERFLLVAPDARCEIVPNGVDVDYFAPAAVPETPLSLIFSGRMNWYPNEHGVCRFLTELWPAIRARVPGARFIVAGMHPTARLREAASNDASVEITGFVEDMRPTLRSAALYVCPILDGGGTRLKILDAMALGKAIVTTPLGAEGLDVADGRELVIRPFGPEFVDAVVALLADPNRRAELGALARLRAVGTYAWPGIGRHLLEVYESALKDTMSRTR